MKVAILTFHAVPNFGANLQALSTVSALRAMGHEPLILNWRPPRLARMYEKDIPAAQRAAHEEFCREYLPQSAAVPDGEGLAALCADWRPDRIVLGSDAVFRLAMGGKDRDSTEVAAYPNPFWMQWSQQLPSPPPFTALSASAGGTAIHRIRGARRRALRADLHRFRTVTVRDWWTRLMVAWITGRLVPITPDPTAVLRRYVPTPVRFAFPPALQARPYLAVSLGGKVGGEAAWLARFKTLANHAGFLVCNLANPEGAQPFAADVTLDVPLHPLLWLEVLRNASGYMGERFHPVVISLFHGKPVLAVDSYSNGYAKLRWTGFRHFSKTYDACCRAGMASACMPSATFWKRMTPEAALDRLCRPLPSRARAFADTSEKAFLTALAAAIEPAGG
jgi:hypothetical protein